MQWFIANWQALVVAILAIDSALIPLFPQVGIFGKIKEVLSGVAPKNP